METENKWNKTNQWDNEIEQLHAIIRKTPLVETTKWGGPVYTYKNKNVVGIGGFKSYFGIWFYNGVFLKDEKKLLINANEENTKSLRQMRFNSANEIDEKLILNYIKEAIEIEEKGLSIPKEKKETIIPELLQKELDNNSELFTKFNKFSPYKQREFIEHIITAKQEKTQIARLEKIIPMILEERGLNDKYRA
ncbi:YdeI/OmpD-associated family protein [Flavobacterium sp.]|uniref:YdeI/OmpD-associated family protein n=1 Tax=Flavobacterium sp. TaxID=239 RepID=UPI002FDDEF01